MHQQTNRVLVVEDEPDIADVIEECLLRAGFSVCRAADGPAAIASIEEVRPDAIVLDVTLPGRDGLSLVRDLRTQGFKTPVLLVSGRSAVENKVEGLDAGADDYLAKPFAIEELVARMRALTRGCTKPAEWLLRVGDLELDTRTRQARRGPRKIELPNLEFRLLEHLMRSAGRVCSRSNILAAVWERNSEAGSNVVDACIRKLREKVDLAGEPKLLNSARGIGYVIAPPRSASPTAEQRNANRVPKPEHKSA